MLARRPARPNVTNTPIPSTKKINPVWWMMNGDSWTALLVNNNAPLRARVATLTPRERQVFDLVIRGKTNKRIAFELGASERTIKAHRHMVMEKMEVRSLAELVLIGRRLGHSAV